MSKPLCQNYRYVIFDDRIMIFTPDGIFSESRKAITRDPKKLFGEMLFREVAPDDLYEAFLMLATYWGLQCNYDELRKIRDEMKEKAE